MQNNCHHIYTNNSLDGAISLLTYMWSHPQNDNFHYTPISNLNRIKNDLKNAHNKSNYVMLDLAINNNFLPELDDPSITIIDHKRSSESFIKDFKHSKIIYKEHTSTSLLLYKLLKDKLEINKNQKMLIALADDYTSYKMSIEDSLNLNIIFWSEYQNRFYDFIEDYFDGFKPITEKQKKSIHFIKNQSANIIKNLQLFSGNLNFGDRSKKTIAVMSENVTPYVIDSLIDIHRPDIILSINIKTNSVFIKQCTSENPIDCSAFVSKFCEGYGNSSMAYGTITPLFMEITKNLNPC